MENSFQNQQLFDLTEQKHFSRVPTYYADSWGTFATLDRGEVDLVAMGSVPAITDYKVVARISADLQRSRYERPPVQTH